MNSDIQRFVDEFREASFSHSEHLIAGLISGEIELHAASEDSGSPASHYLHIYEFRLKNLNDRFENRHTEHTVSLRNDTRLLIDGLQQHPDEICDLWMFTEQPYYNYSIWIGRESRTIFGCVRAVDNRLVTPEIRSELWGNPTPDSDG